MTPSNGRYGLTKPQAPKNIDCLTAGKVTRFGAGDAAAELSARASRGELKATLIEVGTMADGSTALRIHERGRVGSDTPKPLDAEPGTAAGNAQLEEVITEIEGDVIVVVPYGTVRTSQAASFPDRERFEELVSQLERLAKTTDAAVAVFNPISAVAEQAPEPGRPDPYVAEGLTRGEVAKLEFGLGELPSLTDNLTAAGARSWRNAPVGTGGVVQIGTVGKPSGRLTAALQDPGSQTRRSSVYNADKDVVAALDWALSLVQIATASLVAIDLEALKIGENDPRLKLDLDVLAERGNVAVVVFS